MGKVFINENDVMTLTDEYIVEDVRSIRSDDDIHVIPNSDMFNHIDSGQCGCVPVWDEGNRMEYVGALATCKVWVHKSDEEMRQ